MDYFCYISRSKVDNLYENLSATSEDEWTELRLTENDVQFEASADLSVAKIISLFRSGISYGRKGTIQREQNVKLHYTEKLRRVLLGITKENDIPLLDSCISNKDLTGFYFHTRNMFTIQTPLDGECSADSVINLMSDIQGYRLILDCSLRNFSDGNVPGERFIINSSNARFFRSQMPYSFETTFVLLGRDKLDLIGTPLYLKLSAGDILG